MRPYNDNNVYILGAGFSAEAGLPVISSFLARMRDAVDWLDKNGTSLRVRHNNHYSLPSCGLFRLALHQCLTSKVTPFPAREKSL